MLLYLELFILFFSKLHYTLLFFIFIFFSSYPFLIYPFLLRKITKLCCKRWKNALVCTVTTIHTYIYIYNVYICMFIKNISLDILIYPRHATTVVRSIGIEIQEDWGWGESREVESATFSKHLWCKIYTRSVCIECLLKVETLQTVRNLSTNFSLEQLDRFLTLI